jgi:hypothetical protein
MFECVIEHFFHFNLKPIGLVIEIEVANENLPSKNAKYKHVPTNFVKIMKYFTNCGDAQTIKNSKIM